MKKGFAAFLAIAFVTAMGATYITAASIGAGCANAAEAAQYVKITAEQAKARMEANKNAVILDVRTKPEFDEKHINRAVLLPNEEIDAAAAAKAIPNKNAEVLLYCRSGRRSAEAAKKLLSLGYKNVKDFGGIIDWPYETVK